MFGFVMKFASRKKNTWNKKVTGIVSEKTDSWVPSVGSVKTGSGWESQKASKWNVRLKKKKRKHTQIEINFKKKTQQFFLRRDSKPQKKRNSKIDF